MRGWLTSLTRFGVAKICAAVRAMPKHTKALALKWLLNAALQALQAASENSLCDSPRYSADSRYIQDITARHGLLSVTESVALPPQPKGGYMPKILAFDIREWLVPPVLMPVFLVLLVAAAMVIQW